MSNVTIETFQQEDETEIELMLQKIQTEFSENFFSPGRTSILTLITQGELFWTAKKGKEVVGIAGLAGFSKDNCIIKRFFVAKDFRGKKYQVAQRLLEKLINAASNKGYKNVFLGTMSQFIAAQRFYTKNGFTPIPESNLPSGMKLSVLDTLFYTLKVEEFNEISRTK